MAKINYNISERKKIDLRRFIALFAFFVILGLILVFSGISNIYETNSKLSDKINKRDFYREESGKFDKRIQKIEKDISLIRSKWNSKVRFINGNIKKKMRSNIEVLNFIENILPDSLFLTEISISNSSSCIVKLSVVSESTDQLYKFYKKLIEYDLQILSENESGSSYRAKLRLVYKNEKI